MRGIPLPVSNHGIPEDVIQRTLSGAKEFFALPLERKMEVCICIG
jgi:isopenicillin N synthase-like dioxygenase